MLRALRVVFSVDAQILQYCCIITPVTRIPTATLPALSTIVVLSEELPYRRHPYPAFRVDEHHKILPSSDIERTHDIESSK